METLLVTFTLWPLLGIAILKLLAYRLRFTDRPKPAALIPTNSIAEVFVRMYLWPPLVLFILWYALAASNTKQ